MNVHTKQALIIGGGIAGPAVALFLKQAGISSEIYEARATPEGYALSMSSNGVEVLKLLGLDEAVMSAGSPVSRGIMWNGKGKALGQVALAGAGGNSVFIKRVPLGLILTDEAVRQGIPIRHGKKLRNLEVTNAGVAATFADGTTASGDLLIGADGVHSRTRQLIDPGSPGAVDSGLMNIGGYTSGMKIASPPETTHFVFGKRAFFGYHVTRSGLIYWFANAVQAQEPEREGRGSSRDSQGSSMEAKAEAERRQHLLELFRDDQPYINKIIEGSEEVFPWFPSYILPKQPVSWHKGPVVLIGDAVHAISPSSGQGASMALEDAGVLARCLCDISDLEEAFATFERLRRERTEKMFKQGQQNDSGKYMNGPVRGRVRDVMLPVMLKLFANPKASDWIYSYSVDWGAPVTVTPG